jgi:hypothetical protein
MTKNGFAEESANKFIVLRLRLQGWTQLHGNPCIEIGCFAFVGKRKISNCYANVARQKAMVVWQQA